MRTRSFVGGLGLILMGGVAPVVAEAASCGTVAAPTACSVELADGAVFTASDFTLANAVGLGGGNVYQASDIEIDVVATSANAARITFAKNDAGPTPGIVFLANAGQTASFTVAFTITADPLEPGATAAFTSLTNAITASQAGNGSSSVQTILEGTVSCVANTADTSTTCDFAGADSHDAGIIATLAGNGGNTSILSMRETFEVTVVPEPAAGWAMLASAATLAWRRRATRSTPCRTPWRR